MTDDLSPPPPNEGGGDRGDPLIGSVLAGRYRILRHVGEGAMGAVYLGEHLKIGRRDAIKVLRPSLVRDEEAIARFARGARNASRIQHPNVCTVYDFAEADEDFWFLAMEYIDGEELEDLLEREGPLPLDRAVDLTIQIARALGAAHRLGIVHRDLKPGNVMVGRGAHERDVAKVVDFDIAKGSSEGQGADVTRLGFTIGTPEYMSPEQLMVDPLDGRSDLYSLGLVLFRMLTGQLPFRGTTSNQLMLERLNQEPLRLAEVSERAFPEGLQGLLDRALQRRPEDRPADAVAFMTELETAVAGGAPAAVAPPPPAPEHQRSGIPPTRVERRVEPEDGAGRVDSGRPSRPGWLLPAVVAGLVAAAAAGTFAFLGPPSGPQDDVAEAREAAPPVPVEGGSDPEVGGGTGSGASEGGLEEVDTTDPGSLTDSAGPDEERGGLGPADVTDEDADPPVEVPLGATEVASRFDRLRSGFLDREVPIQEFRTGALALYETPRLPDSLRAQIAFGVYAAEALADPVEACRWIRRAADHAPGNERYRALAAGCGD